MFPKESQTWTLLCRNIPTAARLDSDMADLHERVEQHIRLAANPS